MRLHAHPAYLSEICSECGRCFAEVLAGYAPIAILRRIVRGEHLPCPPFIQVSAMIPSASSMIHRQEQKTVRSRSAAISSFQCR